MSASPDPRRPYGTLNRLAAQHDVPLKAARAFDAHRRNAQRRDFPFLFDMRSWWEWWQTDDRWGRRGRHRDGFVMARYGDVGPYSPENVYCATPAQNWADADPARHREAVKRGLAQFLASGGKLGQHLRVRGDGHPRAKAVITPIGRFGSAALAAEAYGVSAVSAAKKARTRWKGWRYEEDEVELQTTLARVA